jgi:polysaccharide biosynthesis protein PslG
MSLMNRCRRLLLLLLAVLAACAGPAPSPTPVPSALPATDVPMPTPSPAAAQPCPKLTAAQRPEVGINAFLLTPDAEPLMGLVADAGFGWVRQQIHWRDINGDGVQFDWRRVDAVVELVARHDKRLLLSLVRSPDWASRANPSGLPDDPRDLADFVGLLAARYRGRVAAYEIWNEPNLAVENGGIAADPRHYLEVLLAAGPAIRRADPCALVLAAPLAATATDDPALAVDDLRFYQQLYTARDGAFLRAADVVAVHSGGGDLPPEAGWSADDPAASRRVFRHLEALRALMQRYGDERPVWVTEYGWTVSEVAGAPPPVSQQRQAAFLLGALELARERYPWVAAMFVWNLNFAVLGPASDEKSAFGILNPDGSPRPAFLALRRELAGRRGPPPPYRPSPPAPPLRASPAPTAQARPAIANRLPGSREALALAWRPDGTLLAAAGWDGRLRLWDSSGKLVAEFAGHGRPARSLAWSDDGRMLASGGWDGRVIVYAGPQWEPLATLEGHAGQVAGVAWEPGGARLLSWGWDGQALVWSPENGRPQLRIAAVDGGPVAAAAWQPGGAAFATAGWAGVVRVWAATSGAQLYELAGIGGDISALAWRPDGFALAASSSDGGLRVWGGPAQEPFALKHRAPLTALAWRPDGALLAAAAYDGAALLVDVVRGEHTALAGHDGPAWSLAWDATGRTLASGGNDGRVIGWDATRRRVLDARLDGPVWALGWGGGRLAAAQGAERGVALLEAR